eukprot:TRINITY_DN3229_c0_g3_i1.p1 TRINITY_DN3229_c0_g3~~TRINITY_DN3229_c0_g3_i1.p1  ORF type:complete len:147 (-),score=20.38 TRINITY_DN3229_c0_g3_i1:65-460(-)
MVPQRQIWSRFHVNNVALRIENHPNSDWEWETDVYPMYPTGAGYIISADLVFWLARQWEDGWLKTWANDDAGLGIYLAGINPKKTDDFRWIMDKTCELTPEPILLHYQQPADLILRQQNWDKCRDICGCGE